MVALGIGQAEQPFLENRVVSVPKSNAKAEDLLVVTEPTEAVFPPSVSA
jgi:hypothetical protein